MATLTLSFSLFILLFLPFLPSYHAAPQYLCSLFPITPIIPPPTNPDINWRWPFLLVGDYGPNAPYSQNQVPGMISFAVQHWMFKLAPLPYLAQTDGSLLNTIAATLTANANASIRALIGGPSKDETAMVSTGNSLSVMHFIADQVSITNKENMLFVSVPYSDEVDAIASVIARFKWKALVVFTDQSEVADAFQRNSQLREIRLELIVLASYFFSLTTNTPAIFASYFEESKVIAVFGSKEFGGSFIRKMNTSFVGNWSYIFSSDVIGQFIDANDIMYPVLQGSIGILPRFGSKFPAVYHKWQQQNFSTFIGEKYPPRSLWYYYDAVDLLLYTINKTLTETGLNPMYLSATTYKVYFRCGSTNFYYPGVSGDFQRCTGRSRTATWDVYNIYNVQASIVGNAALGELNRTADIYFYNGSTFFDDTIIPKPITILVREYNPIIASGFGPIVALCFLFGLFSAVVLSAKWAAFAKHGSFYCAIIIFGAMFSYAGTSMLLPQPTDVLCMAFPWLLGYGFSFVYGCLFLKTWVLYGVFRKAAKFQKTHVTPLYILKLVFGFVMLETIILVLWTTIDPLKVRPVKMLDGSLQYQCKGESSIFWAIFLVYKAAWLLFGAVLSFLTRDVAKEYNESKSIAYAIYNDIVLCVVAAPLAIILEQVPSGVIIIEIAVVLLSFTFTLFILFFDIWYKIFFADSLVAQATNALGASRNMRQGGSRSTPSDLDPSNSTI